MNNLAGKNSLKKDSDIDINFNSIASIEFIYDNQPKEVLVQINERGNKILSIINNPFKEEYSDEKLTNGLNKLLKTFEGREKFKFISQTKNQINSVIDKINTKKINEIKILNFIKSLITRIEKIERIKDIDKTTIIEIHNIKNILKDIITEFKIDNNLLNKLSNINKKISSLEKINENKLYEENCYIYKNSKGKEILVCLNKNGEVFKICDNNGEKLISQKQKAIIKKDYLESKNKFVRIIKTEISREKIRENLTKSYNLELEENKRIAKINKVNSRISFEGIYTNSKGEKLLVKFEKGKLIKCLTEDKKEVNFQQKTAIQNMLNKGKYLRFKIIRSKNSAEKVNNLLIYLEKVESFMSKFENKNYTVSQLEEIHNILISTEDKILKYFNKKTLNQVLQETHPDKSNGENNNTNIKITKFINNLKKQKKEFLL